MPDGDIFAKSVSRPWVKASRLSFSSEDDAVAIDACEKALTHDLNERPWTDFIDVVQDIAEAATADGDVVGRRRMLKNLEWCRDKWPADRFEATLHVAKKILTHGSVDDRSTTQFGTQGNLETGVAAEILTESIIMGIAPACKAARLEHAGKMNVSRFLARTLEMRMLLRNAPGLRSLADQLLKAPIEPGQQIRTPRTRLPRLPQSELVKLPIG